MSDDATTPLHVPPDPREAWRSLLLYLVEHVPGARKPDDLDRVLDRLMQRHRGNDPQTEAAALDAVGDALGLAVSWRTGRRTDIARRLVPDEVAVHWRDGGWVALRKPALRARLDRGPWSPSPEGVVAWASFASAWPAAAFAAGANASPWRRVTNHLRVERRDVSLIVVYGVASSLLALATPVAVQVLVNTIAFGAFRQPLYALTLLVFGALSLSAFLNVLQRIVIEMLQRRLMARVTDDLAARLPRVQVATFDRASGPELVNRFFDVVTVQKALALLMLDGLAAAVSVAVGLSLLAVYHPLLFGFDVILIIAAAVVLIGFGWGGPQMAVLESQKKYALAEWLEIISARPDLFKHDGGDALAIRRTESATRAWVNARADHFNVFIRQVAGALLLQAVALTALLGLGGWLVFDGQLTLGQLVAAEIVVAAALSSLVSFAGKLETLYDLLAAADKLGNLLDVPLDPIGPSGRVEGPGPVTLAAEGLTLPRRPAAVQFAIPARATVAVGVQDALARRHLSDLLVLARDATAGSLRFDGVDARDTARRALQDHMALVRDPRPLPTSLRDNLALGREEVDDDALRDTLDAVGLGSLPSRLPEGLDSPLHPNDPGLGSEEQALLAVARAIVGRPRLIVVDGMLDTLPATCRTRALNALCTPDRTWTLVILTGADDDAQPRPAMPGPAGSRAA